MKQSHRHPQARRPPSSHSGGGSSLKRVFFGRGPRAVATFVCYVVNGTDQRARELLEQELERSGFGRRDRDLATELTYGTLRRRGTLDHVLGRFSRVPLKKIQPRVLEILRVAAYQLLFLDKVPASAAVNEAVKLAKRVSSQGAVGFVNACLRSIARAIVGRREEPGGDVRAAVPSGEGTVCLLDRPVLPDPARSLAEHLAAAHSLPRWLVRRWLRRHDEAQCRELCRRANATPSLVVRVNHLRTTQEALVAELVRGGVWASPLGPQHVALENAGDPSRLRAVRDGLCTVQGVAASASAPLLAPRPGERVLDVCSAPGSKACQLAELAECGAQVVALDVSPRRLAQVRENAQRLGVATVWPVAGDGCACERLFAAAFDAVLVDVPCSNTAVLARRVESRWRVSEGRIAELASLQHRLLESAAGVLRPGGRLVYSTCSLEPEENEQVVERFRAEHQDFRVAASRTLLPMDTADDGGYVALLERAE